MRRLYVVGAVVLGLMTGAPARAGAVQFGAQVSFADDADVGVGARLVWDLKSLGKGLDLITSFDYFFPNEGGSLLGVASVDVNYWEVNANLAYNFRTKGQAHPYVGAGVNIAHVSVGVDVLGVGGRADDTRAGLNLLGGSAFGKQKRFFVELKVELEGGEQVVVAAGVRF